MADEYEIAGKGSFGVVIEPALPNINNNGNLITYPNNVAKIYFNNSGYNKAYNTAKRIKNTLPNLNIQTNTYKKRYTVRNLPNSIKSKVKKYFVKEGINNNNKTIPMLRMPNLGYSAININDNPPLYRKLRQLPYRKICSEMYKCMNVVKAIYSAGYIHGDIRESNFLLNLNNSVMTIIDFDWLMPFNQIYNEYPKFFYSWPPECLFIFGKKIKGAKLGIGNLFKIERKYTHGHIELYVHSRSYETIKGIYSHKDVYTEYDMYIPDDAAKGIIHFLNKINETSPFISYAETENDFMIDYRLYEKYVRKQLFDIAKDYIDMYGLGITFYKLLKRAWMIDTNIHGFNILDNGSVSGLADISDNIKDGSFKVGNINKNDDDEIENFLSIRKFICEELIPGIVHSDYTKRWTIDIAINKFKERLDEIDKKILEKKEKLISNELKRLELLALLRNDKYEGFNNNQALKVKRPYYNPANPFFALANNNNNNNNNSREGGKRNNKKRKTRKNKRN